MFKALRFYPHTPNKHFTIPQTIKNKPRQFGVSQKVCFRID